MTIKLHITTLRDFLDCRRRGWLSSNYVPNKPEANLWFGSTIHAGMDGYYSNNMSVKKGASRMKTYANKTLQVIADNFAPIWGEVEEEFTSLWDLAKLMYENYVNYDAYDPLVRKDCRIIGVEKNYVEVLTPGVVVTGTVDLIIERPDGVWVIDHKTATRPLDSNSLDVDEQLTGYAWLVWKKTGVIPRGILFNSLLKKAPAAPLMLKSGQLSRAKDQPTTYGLYLQEIERLGQNPSDYADILGILSEQGWDKFFIREGSTRNQHELEAFEKRTLLQAQEIRQSLEDPLNYAYPAPSIYKCGYCPFIGVCKSIDDGGDYQALLESRFTVVYNTIISQDGGRNARSKK